MMTGILFSVFFLALAGAAVVFRKYDRETAERLPDRTPFLFLYGMGLRAADWLLKNRDRNFAEERRMAEAVYVRDSPREKFRLLLAKRAVWVWGGLTVSCLIGMLFSFLPGSETSLAAGQLQRPNFGETDRVPLNVGGLGEEPVSVAVKVSGREPDENGMQEIFESVFESLQGEILGDNPSLEEVRSDLKLISVADYGIRAAYESLNPEIISSRGVLYSDRIPEEGTVITIRVTLSYAAMESVFLLYAHCFPPRHDRAYLLSLLDRDLEKADLQGRKESYLKLPSELEGNRLSYAVAEKRRPWLLLLLFPLAGILKAVSERQGLKQEYEKRRHSLSADYSALCFQLSTMVSCGMTVLSAWNRITESYLDRRERSGSPRRYLYEEMVTARNQIRSGVGEAESYHAFGLRCGLDCYLRLTGFLSHNLKQGISGLQGSLEAELSQALENRKNEMLQLGERMNTKLLLPMLLMLGVVIAVLVAPAILDMR